jgi:hypothetical protein
MDNQFGLDVQYFEKWIKRSFENGLGNWTPSELARELSRMAKAADHKVMSEKEFQPWEDISSAPKEKMLLLAGTLDHDKDWRYKIGYYDTAIESWKIFGATWKPKFWMEVPRLNEDNNGDYFKQGNIYRVKDEVKVKKFSYEEVWLSAWNNTDFDSKIY